MMMFSDKNKAIVTEIGGVDLAVPKQLSELSSEPLVSVLLSNYNYAHFLPDSISSVLAQTYRQWELIVCDDGSTDSSLDLLTEFSHGDARIKVFTKENGGQASCQSFAFSKCSGDIICFLDADDTFHPRKLEQIVAAFRANPAAGLVYHQYELTDERGAPLGLPPRPTNLPEGWLFELAVQRRGYVFLPRTSDLSLRHEVAAELFPLRDNLFGCGDHYISITAPFITEIAAIPEPLSTYRGHGVNQSGKSDSGETTIESIQWLFDGVRTTYPAQREFLRGQFGDDFAGQLKLEQSPLYWQYLRALYILYGKPDAGVYGYSPQHLEATLPPSRQRLIWKVLFRLPVPVSQRLLRLWWGQSAWKRYVRPVASFLRLNDRLT